MADPTPEERVAEAMTSSPNGPWLTVSIAPSFAHTALNAVRDALASDDPAVVRAMAERVGLTISSRERFEAVRRDSLDTDGQPHAFSFGSDERWRISEAIHFREYGLSPDTHICMGAIQTFASVSTWSPWREVPDA